MKQYYEQQFKMNKAGNVAHIASTPFPVVHFTRSAQQSRSCNVRMDTPVSLANFCLKGVNCELNWPHMHV